MIKVLNKLKFVYVLVYNFETFLFYYSNHKMTIPLFVNIYRVCSKWKSLDSYNCYKYII